MARLPPFIALRALEAAARHRSYSRAADELAVTHGAVSQQIRRLEEELGLRLFVRQGNRMEPTAAARRLAGRVKRALILLADGVEEAAAEAQAAPLVLSTIHAFAGRWLAPRLSRLPEAVGGVEIQLAERLADFVNDGVDAAVRHGGGPWPGVETAHLFTESWFPVCSPAFLAAHPIAEPRDLIGVPLLTHTEYPWSLWFTGLGLETPTLKRHISFDDSSVLVDAAQQGLGVALAREWLVQQALAEGRLVRPLQGEVRADAAYNFVWRADSPKIARVLALRDWLLAEAGQQKGEDAGALPLAGSGEPALP
jgi:LysR family glycine cleavage system transcriptional activator